MRVGSVDLAASDWHAISNDAAFASSQETTTKQASATQVPDSDHDESLEQLAQQQEQKYWSMLGIEDEPIVLHISSPRSMTPVNATRRSRSRSPLVYDPQYMCDASESPLPSLPSLRTARTRSCNSPPSIPNARFDESQWSPSMSPDPLLLQNATHTPPARRTKNPASAVVADEGYQTRTDSDHVTIVGETSFELQEVQEIQEAQDNMHVEPDEDSTKSLDLDELPPPLTTRTVSSTRKVHDRFLSSPLSSPTNSPEQLPSLIGRREEPSLQPVTQDNAISEAEVPQHDMSDAPLSDTAVAPARQLRQRKAVQLAPYTTEFSKFASIATRNQWEGVVTAGLKQAFLDKEKPAADHADKRQRNPSDDWLVHGNELEDEDDSAFSEPSSEPTSPRRKRRATLASDEEPRNPMHKTSDERYSRSLKEKERDPIADRLKASRKSVEGYKPGAKHIRTSYASTSSVTLEDLDRASSKKSKSRRPTHHVSASSRSQPQNIGASRSVQTKGAKQAGFLPSDVDSSSPDGRARAPRRTQTTSTPQVISHNRTSQGEATLIDSSSPTSSESDSEVAPGSDSPDRPIVNRKERFTLKGKRKRAAMFMMPAVALKRAEADLKLMEREMEEGKQIRLEERDDPRAGNLIDEAAKAKKRWAPANAERRFRYVIDLSTGESESDTNAADSKRPADNDDTQAAMKTWTTMAAGRTHASMDSRAQDSGYWDQVIGRILVRKGEKHRSEPPKRRKVKRADGQSKPKKANREGPGSERRRPPKQTHLHQHFAQPVYLDSADRLYDSVRNGPAAFRPPTRAGTNRDAFWKDLSAPYTTKQGVSEPLREHQPVPPRPLSKEGPEENRDGNSSRFARFSFDYNIRPLPAGLSFVDSTYLAKGYLRELLEEMRRTPSGRPRSPISPFGIGLDNTTEPDVLLQMMPRLVDCMYEYAVGERISASLDCPIGQTLRFLNRYALLDIGQPCTASPIQATIFGHLQTLEARLEQYVAEVDALDQALSSSLLSFRWTMLELSILAYIKNQDASASNIRDSSKHRILEMISEVVTLLLRNGTATIAKEIIRAAHHFQEGENICSVENITCEAWVCLINICAQGATLKGFEFLSSSYLWRLLEHCLTEEAIEFKLHPIIRGETMACTCMTLCALSQFLPDGRCASEPQFRAHWPLITKSLDAIQPGDFAESYNAMSTANRTRTSRYIWTIFARCLTMASRWKWSLLEQGKMIGKMFDLLNSRQLEDFCIDGEADFPRFLSNFKGHIDTGIDSEDTTFQIFLRILAQTAAECQVQGDIKASNLLARIAMRIMPMREHLPYPRHASAGRPVDRSILVNHCALLIVLAAIDPSTSDRRFAKLKTILDFASSDTRARQDYLKGIMFMGIVYKVEGMDLSPVLSWLTHTANYLCQTYCQCAKRRASLLAMKRKSILAPRPVHQNAVKAGSRQGSTSAQEKDYDSEIISTNREMGEMAILEGLLLGAVQQIMLAKPQKSTVSPAYPPLEYLNDAWILQVLSSPMARDPVVGSQVLQCIQRFIALRNECLQQVLQPLQGESQDEFGDMDFDYNDPALNAMLGIADAPNEAKDHQDEAFNYAQLDQRFIDLLKTNISPLLYSILSDLSAVADAGQDSGVPEFPHKKAYTAGVVDLWATCAGILVQKGQRDWKYYIEPFGKESWQRLADVVGKFEIGSMFVHTMLTVDPSSFKAHRAVLLEVMFRRLAAPSSSTHDAMLLTRLLNAEPAFLLWQNLPFHLEDLLGEYLINLEDYTKQRTAAFRAVFANCKKILEKGIIVHEGIERSCAAVCREQHIDDALVYRLLGYLMSSMRDFLDALGVDSSANASRKEYAAFCRQAVFLLKEELGTTYATEQTIPSLRLLAGVINGTVR